VKAALVLLMMTSTTIAQPGVAVSKELAKQLATGLPVELELTADGQHVGACRITYDIWQEVYRVDDRVVATEPVKACIDWARYISVRARAIAAHRSYVIVPTATRPREPWVLRTHDPLWCGGLLDLSHPTIDR
jgi:hypothetical protein